MAPWWAGRVNAVRVVTETQGPELTYGPNVTIARIPVGRDYSGSVGIDGPFDVAVLGGEDLDGCAKATLGHVRDTGLVIVENSDRQACAVAIEIFAPWDGGGSTSGGFCLGICFGAAQRCYSRTSVT